MSKRIDLNRVELRTTFLFPFGSQLRALFVALECVRRSSAAFQEQRYPISQSESSKSDPNIVGLFTVHSAMMSPFMR